ncbi:ribosomal protein S18 acetylase RimI-like enzyme [Allocatelliglobosispora scoriae]|uniref:Ribosomal protein S18 acetylase RimI-like enzyme n=1 Tax=Allocatelliglobosispora scoriae TaxID=643052 RepID=A0A841C446_9ACTN|nr:GNAT family N-acetyltransferase [Allocatelliglobosispora scoriae]MBB5873740.1 ribosomal protein S18 acetylase RimI-like enzyme [Allocatelliglobosispora scoriae]
MTTTRPATADETDNWSAGWQARLHSGLGSHPLPSGAVNQHVQRRLQQLSSASERAIECLVDERGTAVGVVVMTMPGRADGNAYLLDIWVEPEHRRRGHGRAALAWAGSWAVKHGGRPAFGIDPSDPAQVALLGDFPVRARQMVKAVAEPIELPPGVVGRPMTDAEFTGWRAEQVEAYAVEKAEAGLGTIEESRAQSAAEFDELLPGGVATAGHALRCVEVGGEVVGTVWIGHGYAPEMSWVYGVEVAEAHRGRGYGRAAMLLGEQTTLEGGNSWLGLNVFGPNERALSLYRSLSYDVFEERRAAD